MRAKRGPVQLAKLAGAPMLPSGVVDQASHRVEAGTSSSFRCRSGRGALVWGDPISVPRDADDGADGIRRVPTLEAEMNRITAEADRIAGVAGDRACAAAARAESRESGGGGEVSFSPALSLYRAAHVRGSARWRAWLNARARQGKEDAASAAASASALFGAAATGRAFGLAARRERRRIRRGAGLIGSAWRRAIPRFRFCSAPARAPPPSLPPSARRRATTHVYAPLDRRDAVRRFLAHWRPDLGVFVESEVWPNLILEAQRRAAFRWRWSMRA